MFVMLHLIKIFEIRKRCTYLNPRDLSINLTETLRNFERTMDFVVFLQILIDLSITRIRTSLSLFKGTLPACARNKEESLLWNNKFQVSGSSKRLLRFSYAVTIFLPLPRSRFKLCVNACETPEEKREGRRKIQLEEEGKGEREREFVLGLISAYKLPFA